MINFEHSRTEAFLNGMLKGMAAPFLLYGTFSAPKLPEIPMLTLPPDQTCGSALRADWQRIGDDMRRVISRHEQENSQKPSRSST